jgi:hypothetical protein
MNGVKLLLHLLELEIVTEQYDDTMKPVFHSERRHNIMDKECLLTYQDEKGTHFSWFESEEEMDCFIDENKINIIEGLHIKGVEVIR